MADRGRPTLAVFLPPAGKTADLLDGTLPQFQHSLPSVADGVFDLEFAR